jgi:hypothetical protein
MSLEYHKHRDNSVVTWSENSNCAREGIFIW